MEDHSISPPRPNLRSASSLSSQNEPHRGQLGIILSYLDAVESDPRASIVVANSSRHRLDDSRIQRRPQETEKRNSRFVWDEWGEVDEENEAPPPLSPASTLSRLSSPGRKSERHSSPQTSVTELSLPPRHQMVTHSPGGEGGRGGGCWRTSNVSPIGTTTGGGGNGNQDGTLDDHGPVVSAVGGGGDRARTIRTPSSSSSSSAALSSRTPSSSSSSSSSTALAFREVQVKVRAMQQELEGRKEEVRRKEKSLSRAKKARAAGLKKVEQEWAQKLEEVRKQGHESVEKQTAFLRRLEEDRTKLREKYEALSAQAERVERQRGGEVGGARREVVSVLQKERAQWVAVEKQTLSKLAAEKQAQLKDNAVRALEPTLHELIRGQRQALRNKEAQLEDNQRRELEGVARRHAEEARKLQQLLDQQGASNLSSQRELWTKELQRVMSLGEQALVEAKESARVEAAKERAGHDAEWRRVRQEQDAEAEALRSGGKHKASSLCTDHAQTVEDLQASHRAAVHQQRARHATDLEAFQRITLAEVSEKRRGLDHLALRHLKAKASNELAMVETRLNREADGEVEKLTAGLKEQRARLEADLATATATGSGSAGSAGLSTAGAGSGKHRTSNRKQQQQEEWQRNLNAGEDGDGDDGGDDDDDGNGGGGGGSGARRRVKDLERLLVSVQAAAAVAETKLFECRERRKEAAAQVSLRAQEKLEQGGKVRRLKSENRLRQGKAVKEAEERMRQAEQAREESEAEQETELKLLSSDLGAQRLTVERKVSAVLHAKEKAAAELAQELAKCEELNDKRSAALARLRQSGVDGGGGGGGALA